MSFPNAAARILSCGTALVVIALLFVKKSTIFETRVEILSFIILKEHILSVLQLKNG